MLTLETILYKNVAAFFLEKFRKLGWSKGKKVYFSVILIENKKFFYDILVLKKLETFI